MHQTVLRNALTISGAPIKRQLFFTIDVLFIYLQYETIVRYPKEDAGPAGGAG